MLPWEHAGIAYLFYSFGTRATTTERPTDEGAILTLFGSQFPDLVDKPLAWTFGLLPSGRSLAHSALTATVLIVGMAIVLRRWDRSHYALPFAVGYVSHLLTDLPVLVLGNDLGLASYLLYPVLPAPLYPNESFDVVASLVSMDSLSPIKLCVFLAILSLWIVDGRPGPGILDRSESE